MLAKKLTDNTAKMAHKELIKKASNEVFKQYDNTFKKLSKN